MMGTEVFATEDIATEDIVTEDIATESIVTENVPSYEVTISFAGDCTLGEFEGQTPGNQFKDYSAANGTDYFLSNVKGIFEQDDLTFVNLEGALTTHPQVVEKKYPIKGVPESVNCLTSSSVEVCNLSNNHIYDCGKAGFEETKTVLSENNIGYCGEGNVYTTTVNGIQVSFLGYQGWKSTTSLKNTIASDIASARESGSMVVCVEFHWGSEYKFYSDSTQEDLAHWTIDSGADIVVGAHPHVIQGIEKYNGKLICYSLGNFCFGANKNPSDKDTYILQQTFKMTPEGVVYGDTDVIPCSVSSVTNKNDYKPTPLSGEDADRVIERLRTYSEKYADSVDYDSFLSYVQ
jgi:poly-gamma-glutamate synthesis protein (capsule biosynthesis protein)